MTGLSKEQAILKKYFKQYQREIIHLRKEFQVKRLCLVFGAGVSMGFGLPNWRQLVDKIAQHPEIKGLMIGKDVESLSAKVEILQRHFSNLQGGLNPSSGSSEELSKALEIKGKWFNLLRELIYEKCPDESKECIYNRHPYIREYLEIISNLPVTITYNFDSCVEMCLDRWSTDNEQDRLYETIFPEMLPTRNSGSIYHINGYLPKNKSDIFSDDLVFTEQQFADQFLETTTGRFATLAHYFASRTCLFIGLSLSDENMRYLLRRGAISNPGHYHYFIKYQPKDNPDTQELKKIISDYYFETYNLITLFLDESEIKILGQLIRYDFKELKNTIVQNQIPLKRVYYLTGVPGAGKTSVRRAMRGLSIYPEWMTQALPLMSLPFSSLKADEQRFVDNWTADQFKKKNEKIRAEHEGIFVVDRAPLDPLSFTKKEDVKVKKRNYWDAICPADVGAPIESGKVILLVGNPKEIASRRARKSGRMDENPEYIKNMQESLLEIYKADSTRILYTQNKKIPEVIKEIARIIYREEYSVMNFKRPNFELEG